MRTKILASAAVFTLSVSALWAGPMEPVSLDEIDHIAATLVVVAPDGTEASYSQADLEQMATYSMTTITPWRAEPATFEGVLLRDVLAANGLSDGFSINVTAENDYSTTISSELLETVDIMVATRVNGMPHNRRERGPIQFVIDHDAFQASELTSESNFVWMAAHIEAHE